MDPDGKDIKKAVNVIKNSKNLSLNTKSAISSKMITNLYNAEDQRLSLLERIGIDGNTIGRGQLGESAYNDVVSKLNNEMNAYSKSIGKDFSGDFKTDMKDNDLEDFIVTAYLSLCIEGRQKKGRTSKDAAKFGIGYYHGASMSIIRAQDQANDKLSFDEIEQIMEKGSKESADIIKYIKEVYGEN